MALLSSPPPTSTMFRQSNAPTGTASLSEIQLGQSAGGPSRGSINGRSTGRPLINLENGRPSLHESNRLETGLVNGHSAGHVGSPEPSNQSFETQNITRAWTENHQAVAHRPKTLMTRSRTNYEPENIYLATETSVEEHGELRHGWEVEYNSSEFLGQLNSEFYMYYTDKRHESGGKPKDSEMVNPLEDWRHRERSKTVSAALILCLNIGVDPPDVYKTQPTAIEECWTNPISQTQAASKMMEIIGKKLQDQYEGMSMKTRYKQYLDPSVEETKKFCTSLRRNAKEERVLFHYNGHGVPLPTPSGEFWVFNKDYTQYIPVSMYDLQAWLGGPVIYIYDCSHAGNIIANFDRFVEKHEAENAEARARDPNAQLQNYSNNIQLAACQKTETLPTNPDLPNDLFTACLTTPIVMSMTFHVLENPLSTGLNVKDVRRVPGRAAERRSPIGELNWILTAITDTIAWNVLPRSLFRQLFRQDLMVAALFRNFLVAQRIMRSYGCHPISTPEIPSTHDHPLWEAWDLAIEMVLSQLDPMLKAEAGGPSYEYKHSTFFTEQLTAFDVYLQQGAPKQQAPTQLPIVLQVLLSQVHRLRALILLSKFLDLGPWAVNLALTIGIFPYVVKLLQSPAHELKPIMIFIWARIVAVDAKAVQADLLKDSGYQYFTKILFPETGIPVANATEHKAMSAFVIAMFCRGFPQGQQVCLSPELIDACVGHLQDSENPLLRQWSCLCISMLWKDFPEAKWVGIRCFAHHRLCALVVDPVPEVRAASVHALTSFLGIPDLTEQVTQNEETIASALMSMTTDGNAMVRKELLVFFSTFVKRYQNKFLVAAYENMVEERDKLMYSGFDNGVKVNGTDQDGSENAQRSMISRNSVQNSMWLHLLILSVDGHPEVAQAASIIVDHVHETLVTSPLAPHALRVIDNILGFMQRSAGHTRQPSAAPPSQTSHPTAPSGPQNPHKSEGYLSTGLRRNASVAAALKYLGLGGSGSTESLPSSSETAHQTAQQKRMAGPVRPGIPAEWSTPPNQNDTTSTSAKYQRAKIPLPKDFKKHDPNEPAALPLESVFFEWSIEYFREPQMKPNEPDEPGSDDYNSRLWRRNRNEKTLAMTQPLKGVAGSSPWDVPTGFFNNGSQPTSMCFHQFEDHLAIADDRDSICIWNWQQSSRLNRFSNGNPKGSRINEARFINEDDQALIMTGSSDGVIKIFRNYESEDVELVSAFRALSDIVPSNKNAGLVLDWQQGQGKLLVAGDVKVIKVWNAATEICTSDIPARSGSCITSLTSDQVAGNVFCAGYGDGVIRIFDTRQKPALAMVRCWRKHKQWVTNVHMQRGGFRELISGSRNGEVKLWDIRKDDPIREVSATSDTMRTLSVHEHAPVFATGSDTHALTVFNVNGASINTIHPYTPFLTSAKTSPIACTSFHPHRMMLAVGSLGHGHVNVYTCVGKVAAHDRLSAT